MIICIYKLWARLSVIALQQPSHMLKLKTMTDPLILLLIRSSISLLLYHRAIIWISDLMLHGPFVVRFWCTLIGWRLANELQTSFQLVVNA